MAATSASVVPSGSSAQRWCASPRQRSLPANPAQWMWTVFPQPTRTASPTNLPTAATRALAETANPSAHSWPASRTLPAQTRRRAKHMLLVQTSNLLMVVTRATVLTEWSHARRRRAWTLTFVLIPPRERPTRQGRVLMRQTAATHVSVVNLSSRAQKLPADLIHK